MNRLIKAAHRHLFKRPAAAASLSGAGPRPSGGRVNVTRELAPAEYRQVIGRVREIAVENLPPGAQLLVVSRGDDELVQVEDRAAWHFPRAPSGKYAGYHPDNSADAVAHLQELQAEGAQYLLVPAPSFWWLDYYPELFQHLAQRATMVWDDESCVIFDLERAAGEVGESPHPEIARPLKRVLEALLPAGARVAVLSSGDSGLLAVEGRQALHFPQGSGGRFARELDADQALDQLADLQSRGVEYLVVPHLAPSWLDEHPGFLGRIAERYGTIARREGVCTVFELNDPADRRRPARPHRHAAAAGLTRRRASREAMFKTDLERTAGEASESPHAGIARPLKRLLEALLPAGARVAMLTSGDSELLAVEGHPALHFPQGSGRFSGELDATQALEQLADLQRKGIEYLVVPHSAPSWLDDRPDFLAQVEARYPVLARREGVCTVYALNDDAETQGRDV